MLRFSNDTRYKNIDSASVLSDFVIEKLLASGKFNFKETRPIDEDIEALLYDAKTRELLNLTASLNKKNLNALFEGQGFDKTQAQSIGTADVGQIISPSITSAIANQHGAEYIIHGTVIRMASGHTPQRDLFGNYTIFENCDASAIVIETDLRVIKAATGEVVWRQIVQGSKKTSLTRLPYGIKLGSAKLTSDLYDKAMADAAQKIADALIEDLDSGRLFAK